MNFNEIKLILKRLYKEYVRKHLKRIILALLLSIVVAGTTSAIAWLLDPAVKKIFIEKNVTLSWLIPILIILAFAGKGLSLYTARLLIIRVGEEVSGVLKKQIADNIVRSDIQTLDSRHSGKYVSNVMFDSGQVQNLVSTGVLNLMKDSFSVIALVGVMIYQNWKLALFAMLMMPLAAGLAKSLGKRIGKAVGKAGEASGVLVTFMTEIFRGARMIRIYQKEDKINSEADLVVDDMVEKNIKTSSVMIRATPLMETLTGIMIAGFIAFSGQLIAAGEIGVNNFFSFLAAMMLAYQPVKSLTKVNISIGQGLSAAKRIIPIIDIKNEINLNETSKNLELTEGTITFDNVSFYYQSNNENKVLKNIDIQLNGGKMTALVGHSGSGKSTLLNMIPRIYNPTNGSIKIDNQDLVKINLSSLRKEISIVDQNTTLFDDTVFNNIKYAKPDASEEEIFTAAKLSMSEEFIRNLENGFETKIGENGVRLSGGEKQRLSIARAFLKKSKIILLDEATSSLDTETEEKIQKAIDELTYNKTTIVIAHRLSTILNSDKIYVMDKGKISDSGDHKELLLKSDVYKNFYEKQIQK